ncbi:hypothetical protein CRUP_004107, partial [Coryphaenoides rupestris]
KSTNSASLSGTAAEDEPLSPDCWEERVVQQQQQQQQQHEAVRRCILITVIIVIGGIIAYTLPRWSFGEKTMSHIVGEGLATNSSQFTLEGKPFLILGGSIHYFRVPRAHWEDRLLKMKACGLNTLTTYVPWNLHEPERGLFDFQDHLDLEAYLSLAAKLGLRVILRPGPYICAEWDLGGLPSWLLRDTNMKLRTTYPGFTEAVDSFFHHLMKRVVPYQHSKGGPIIAVQVENEYGSYAKDTEYMSFIKEKPKMVMEYWSDMVAVVSEILKREISINLYMFHGGTNFGFMNGAFAVGLPAPKPMVPALHRRSAHPPLVILQHLSLWDGLPFAGKPFRSSVPVNMENLPVNNNNGQSYGYTLYETTIASGGTLDSMNNVRDRALVFLNRHFVGVLDYTTRELPLLEEKGQRTLSLLVENCGRVNYGRTLDDQRKGLVGDITLNKKPLRDFIIYSLDMKADFVNRLQNSGHWKPMPHQPAFPAFLQVKLYMDSHPTDTFVKLPVLYLSTGKNLVRYCSIGATANGSTSLGPGCIGDSIRCFPFPSPY